MMQPASGVGPQMAPMPMDQQQHQYQQLPPAQQYQQPPPVQQYQQPPPAQQYQQPPPAQQWMMMPPQQLQQPPPMWTQQPTQASVPPPQLQVTQTQPQQYAAAPTASSEEIRSLWIGDLQYWMDESYVSNCFYPTGEFVSVKIIRSKQTGQPEGYGFLEFRSRLAAERALQTYNGTPMPNAEQNFRLNWATLGAGEKRADDTPDYTIFVGDLASDVSDYVLQETFKAVYSSVKSAKVVTDRDTGRSKGYGFVKFGEESEQLRAMSEMNGVLCSSRAMRIGPAATKKPAGGQQYQKGHREALILGGLEQISAEMIPL